MHIPDGFINIPTAVATSALSVGALAACLRSLKKTLADRLIPTMGIMAAFVFAAQMFNFPVALGTSGHLMGGVLAAVALGPCAATVVLTVVLIIQCLVFQDGGITALGANIFNMAIMGTWSGYFIFKIAGRIPRLRYLAIFLGAWASVVIASFFCAAELAFSQTAAARLVIPAMLAIHAIIGVGEGIVTVLVVSFVKKVRPELIEDIPSPFVRGS